MASNSDPLATALIARCKTLVNNDLKRICKEEGRIQSGNKAQLQTRVIQMINDAVAQHDVDTIQRLRHRINNHGAAPPSPAVPAATPSIGDPYSSPGVHAAMPNIKGYGGQYSPYTPQPASLGGVHRIFKPSPFFEVRELLLGNIVLESSPSHRQTVTRTLSLPVEVGLRMKDDPTLKLLLLSAIDMPISNYAQHDVTFPAQIEVKINDDEVRANYKGLKNKPGSTRPADITDFVRKSPPNYKNTIQITYALTQKKYTLYIYLVKKHSVEELAQRITRRNVITKQSVLEEMRRKASDPDIEVGSINMGLKDPISTLRIKIPCRSTVCSHMQCFDAESFLQLQEQAPTWNCPICNKTVSFEALAVDQYVQEILDSVPKSTDQVTIEPNGKWSYGNGARTDTPRTNGFGASPGDSDDDLIDITDHRISAIKSEAVPTPQSLVRTPPLSSREASSAPRSGNKRKSEVIDLTLSDDDEPARPAKKVAYIQNPSSLPDPSRRYQAPVFGTSSVPMRPQSLSRNSMSSSLNLSHTPTLQNHNHNDQNPYGTYRPPPPRHSYSGQGTAAYPSYLGSSP